MAFIPGMKGLRPVVQHFHAALKVSERASFSTTSPAALARMSIIGRLGATPEIGTTNSGVEIMKYAVATTSGPKDNRSTNWWKVSAFQQGPIRDIMASLGKGSLVYVEGDASVSKFTDKDGRPNSSLSIRQRSIDILERRDPDEVGPPNTGESEGEGNEENQERE